MWEKIILSGALVAGAIVLFVLFTAALIIYEKRSENQNAKRPVPRQKPRKPVKPACPPASIRRRRAA